MQGIRGGYPLDGLRLRADNCERDLQNAPAAVLQCSGDQVVSASCWVQRHRVRGGADGWTKWRDQPSGAGGALKQHGEVETSNRLPFANTSGRPHPVHVPVQKNSELPVAIF